MGFIDITPLGQQMPKKYEYNPVKLASGNLGLNLILANYGNASQAILKVCLFHKLYINEKEHGTILSPSPGAKIVEPKEIIMINVEFDYSSLHQNILNSRSEKNLFGLHVRYIAKNGDFKEENIDLGYLSMDEINKNNSPILIEFIKKKRRFRIN